MEDKEERHRKIELALGEPFFEDFSENTFKIRRNLIAAATISIIYKKFNLIISPDSSFLGVKLDGLTPQIVENISIIIVSYLLVHFIVCTSSHFWEWRLRLSGMRVRYLTSSQFEGEDTDSPAVPRQSTLFWHLKQKGSNLENLNKKLSELTDILTEYKNGVSEAPLVTEKIEKDLEEIRKLSGCLDRTIISLKRFDAWFSNFNFFQLFRWLFVEFTVPLALSICALKLLIWA